MTELISFLIGSLILYLSYYIVGVFIFEKFYSKVKIINYHETTLLGLFVISFIALFLNFFSPLTPLINIFFLLSSLCLIFFIKKNNFAKIFYHSLIFIIALVVFTVYARNPEDASLYHLSYVSLINVEKINFGISNFHSRFGHTSIIQYLSAISFIPFLSKYLIISQNNFFYCLIVTILFSKLRLNLTKKETYNSCFNFLCLIYISLKLAKFSDWGNDLLPAILTFYITSFLIDYLTREKNKKNFFFIYFFLLLIITFIVFSKISYIVLYSILLFLIYDLQNIKKIFNYKIISSFFLIILVLVVKNLITTSCIIYPIPFTCFETIWSSGELNNVNKLYLEAKSWSMGISDLETNNAVTPEIFIKNFYWVNTWVNTHFIKVSEKIFSFILYLFLIIIIIKFKFKFKDTIQYIPKFHKYLLFSFLIYVYIWFISAPLFRYGTGFIITLIIILVIPVILKYFNFKHDKCKLFYKFAIIVIFSTILVKNIIRVMNDRNEELIPKTFDNSILNSITIDSHKIFYKSGSECFYPKNSPCLKHKPVGIKKILTLGKYKIYIPY